MGFKNTCFLCGKPSKADEKKDKEHILANAFLGQMGLKEQMLNIGGGKTAQYSRIKVPAHKSCNSSFGSRFEQEVGKLISNFEFNKELLSNLHQPSDSKAFNAVKYLLCHWLTKLYLGFSWWEVSLANHPDEAYRAELAKTLNSDLLNYFQKCFREELSFVYPSSLYYFEVNEDEQGMPFDLSSRHDFKAIFVKIKSHLLVMLLGDDFLTSEYFKDKQHTIMQESLMEDSKTNPQNYIRCVAEIWAVRRALPIEPKIEVKNDYVKGHSRIGYEMAPEISTEKITLFRNELIAYLIDR